MSWLNKILLAIIVSLLITGLVEIMFIFVYKPLHPIPAQPVPTTQSVVTQPVVTPKTVLPNVTPIPTPLPNGLDPGWLTIFNAWQTTPGEIVTLDDTATGTIDKIDKKIIYVNISDDPNTKSTRELITDIPSSPFTLSVFQLNTNTDKTTPLTVNDLVVGDKIKYTVTVYLTMPPSVIKSMTIYKLIN